MKGTWLARKRLKWGVPFVDAATLATYGVFFGKNPQLSKTRRFGLSFAAVMKFFSAVCHHVACAVAREVGGSQDDSGNRGGIVFGEKRIKEALDQLATLDKVDANNAYSARSVWDWVFKSDGFFAEFDAKRKQEEKRKALLEKAALVGNGARTSQACVLGAVGVPNMSHGFYGDEPVA